MATGQPVRATTASVVAEDKSEKKDDVKPIPTAYVTDTREDKDVTLKEYELLADGWNDPRTGVRHVKGDAVKVDEAHAKVLLRLGSLGEKGTIKKSEEDAKKEADRHDQRQRIHMGLEDPSEDEKDKKDKEEKAKSEDKSSDK